VRPFENGKLLSFSRGFATFRRIGAAQGTAQADRPYGSRNTGCAVSDVESGGQAIRRAGGDAAALRGKGG
jgi:hypothetical protein